MINTHHALKDLIAMKCKMGVINLSKTYEPPLVLKIIAKYHEYFARMLPTSLISDYLVARDTQVFKAADAIMGWSTTATDREKAIHCVCRDLGVSIPSSIHTKAEIVIANLHTSGGHSFIRVSP